MSKQYGFYYDAGRCIQCRTCEVACKSTNNIEPGVKWRRVIETWGGNYPDVTRTFFSLACTHCEEPACIVVCPTGAIRKRVEDGIVVVDKDKCNGCQVESCPAEALYAGTIDELLEMAKGKTAMKMDGATKPSMVIVS